MRVTRGFIAWTRRYDVKSRLVRGHDEFEITSFPFSEDVYNSELRHFITSSGWRDFLVEIVATRVRSIGVDHQSVLKSNGKLRNISDEYKAQFGREMQ